VLPPETRNRFTEHYKYKQFLLWYNEGKPSLHAFYPGMTPDENGNIPAELTVKQKWYPIWQREAEVLDAQVKGELEKRLVKEKVEMLSRHARLGRQMQDIGLDFLTNPDNVDEITSNTAVRLLIAGIEIERESTGLPDALEKMMNRSDEQLMERAAELLKDSPLEIEAIND